MQSRVCVVAGLIRVDGKTYRYMGPASVVRGVTTSSVTQTNVTVFPTRTVYEFHQDGVQLVVTFVTPAMYLDDDDIPDMFSAILPVSYITLDVKSIDGKKHNVQLYYDNSGEPTVMNASENIQWSRAQADGVAMLSIGTVEQNYVGQTSDRINWGYWYLSFLEDNSTSSVITSDATARSFFSLGKPFPSTDDHPPRPCNDNWPVLAVSWDLGSVGSEPVRRFVSIVYDQVYSIRYFGHNMAPLWRLNWEGNVTDMLTVSVGDAASLNITDDCAKFDETLLKHFRSVGGDNFTTLASLAWRQVIGSTDYVYNDKEDAPWGFLKEISSGGFVSTVDVLLPAAPVFLYKFPQTFLTLLLPILAFANNETHIYGDNVSYNLSWAPHSLGHWPVCDMRPNQEEQMPMEVTADMLIMLAQVSKFDDTVFFTKYWPLLRGWGDYLLDNLPDPASQLCTDDFEGPSPHNVNLAAKGIIGVAALAHILTLDGQKEAAKKYSSRLSDFILFWLKNASDGNHYDRQYDVPSSWSMKYNLMFQKALNLDLFPQSVFDTECAFYQEKLTFYGIPLDERHDYTKADWLMFTAAMCNDEQFMAITDRLYRFATETTDRVPLTDWYDASTGRRQGFQGRAVVGGLLSRMLMK